MKKTITVLLLACLMLFSGAMGTACSSGVARDKSNKLVELMDQTFKSAEFVVTETEKPSEGGSQNGGSQNGGTQNGNNQKPNPNSPDKKETASAFAIKPNESKYWYELEMLSSNFMGIGGGVPLTENNKKALKGEALSESSLFAGMLKALIHVYGDNVFTNSYSYSGVTFVVSGENDDYTIQGVIHDEDGFRSAIQMNFRKQGDDDYSATFVQFSVNDDVNYPLSTMIYSAFSKYGVVRAELSANNVTAFEQSGDFSSLKVNKMTAAYFGMDAYASVSLDEPTPDQCLRARNFAGEVLGIGKDTYAQLKNIKKGVSISDSDAEKLSEYASANFYVSPYYYQTNETYVRESYSVPENVTVVKSGSIPATKVVHIHKNVTKIESNPFQKPDVLEKIMFADPVNGKLEQIGSFDDRQGIATFILSMTKVKNFTLPSTVKKLELGKYIVNTHVECIDLSTYNPEWITDRSKFTFEFNDREEDFEKDSIRNNAYANLVLSGTSCVPYKEVRYIDTLYMPQFNMGIKFNEQYHLTVVSDYGEFYTEAYRDFYKGMQASEKTMDEFAEQQGYEKTYGVIGTLVVSNKHTVIPEDLLYGDFGDKIGSKSRGVFDFKLYSDDYYSGEFKPSDQLGDGYYRSIEKILVGENLYEQLLDYEESRYNATGGSVLGRVVIDKKK